MVEQVIEDYGGTGTRKGSKKRITEEYRNKGTRERHMNKR